MISDTRVDNKSGSMLQLMGIPAVMVTASVIVMTSITWGFLDPTLEPHLRQVSKLTFIFVCDMLLRRMLI